MATTRNVCDCCGKWFEVEVDDYYTDDQQDFMYCAECVANENDDWMQEFDEDYFWEN